MLSVKKEIDDLLKETEDVLEYLAEDIGLDNKAVIRNNSVRCFDIFKESGILLVCINGSFFFGIEKKSIQHIVKRIVSRCVGIVLDEPRLFGEHTGGGVNGFVGRDKLGIYVCKIFLIERRAVRSGCRAEG